MHVLGTLTSRKPCEAVTHPRADTLGLQPAYAKLSTIPEMFGADKSNLEQRIEECHLKIEALEAFRDDPKIDKIIKALKKQMAEESRQLCLLP